MNNVVVNRTTVVNVTNINVYKNTTVEHAVVAVREDHFGRGGNVQQARIAQVDARRLEPARTPIRVTPDASSYVAGKRRVLRVRPRTRSPAPWSPRGRRVATVRVPPKRLEPTVDAAWRRAPRARATQPARRHLGSCPRPSRPRRARCPRGRRSATARWSEHVRLSRGNSARRSRRRRHRLRLAAPRRAPTAPSGPIAALNVPAATPNVKTRRVLTPAAPRPEASAPRPDTGAQRPGGNAPRPDGNAPRPGPAPSAPPDVGRGNERPTPPPAQPSPSRARTRPQPQAQPQRLPGEPANRISPQRAGAPQPARRTEQQDRAAGAARSSSPGARVVR